MYLDSAIIVKLLVREPESGWFNKHLAGHPFETSELAVAEVRSALLAKERTGEIAKPERVAAGEKFREMIEDDIIRLLPMNRQVIERASAIQTACHPGIPLRTLDALHVATADLHQCQTIATTDTRMRSACEQLAIALFPGQIKEISITN